MLCLPVLRARPAHAVGQRCRIKGRPGCRRAWSVKASRLVSRTKPCLLPWSADRYKHRPTLSLARVAAHDALHYDQGSTCEHGTGGTLPAHQMRPARPYLCDCEQVETSKRRRARVGRFCVGSPSPRTHVFFQKPRQILGRRTVKEHGQYAGSRALMVTPLVPTPHGHSAFPCTRESSSSLAVAWVIIVFSASHPSYPLSAAHPSSANPHASAFAGKGSGQPRAGMRAGADG